MKASVHVLVAMVMIAASYAWALNLTGRYAHITIDGLPDDWGPTDVLYPDSETGDGTPESANYESISVCNDNNNLYLLLITKGQGGGSVTHSWTRHMIVDIDSDDTTGYRPSWMTHGYDRLVTYGNNWAAIYDFAGSSQDQWSWGNESIITYAYSDNAIEWSIPRTRVQTTDHSRVYMTFWVSGGGASETWTPLWESSAGWYQFIPEPGLGMWLMGAVAALVRQRH